MTDIKAEAAALHEKTAHELEIAAKMHHDAAKQTASGNFQKAQDLATAAAEADTEASKHALEAVNLYRQRDAEVEARKAEAASEDAARQKKHEAKLADKG